MSVGSDAGATRKRVLVVDYLFPPIAGPGIQRTLGYVGHLHEYGWNPIVLTVRDGDHSMLDSSLLRRVPNHVSVVRTRSLEPVRFARKLLRRFSVGRNVEIPIDNSGRPLWGGSGWVRYLEKIFLFPDRRIGWLPFALGGAVAFHRQTPFSIVYSTSTNIMTGHIIAYLLKRYLGKPWVADFQDAWLHSYVSFFPSAIHRRLARALERFVVHNADRITVATHPHKEMLCSSYPEVPREKIAVIPMGFDPHLFDEIEGEEALGKFTVTHLGSFYSSRSPAAFLGALGSVLRDTPQLADQIQVNFLGTFDAQNLRVTEQLIEEFNLGQVVQLCGVLPYPEALRHLAASDLLLLITDDGIWGQKLLASKLLEYFAAKRPILALAPEGVTSEMVQKAKVGVVVPPGDTGSIAQALLELLTRWQEGRLEFEGDVRYIDRFVWPRITEKFATILDECTGGGMERAPMVGADQKVSVLSERMSHAKGR
jgi:glycosyltransferase involved in cell wall biosynthesis